ncbi:MAG: hypothetical protein QG671_4529 [Actinomycetota bacterium]|nr:hypothetical protein [Actinomycetota bacterium]
MLAPPAAALWAPELNGTITGFSQGLLVLIAFNSSRWWVAPCRPKRIRWSILAYPGVVRSCHFIACLLKADSPPRGPSRGDLKDALSTELEHRNSAQRPVLLRWFGPFPGDHPPT